MKIVISRGYGAGWSTWNWDYPDMLTDAHLISLIEEKADETDIQVYCERKWPDSCLLAIQDDLTVVDLPKGTRFCVQEYDGNEYVMTDENFMIAKE